MAGIMPPNFAPQAATASCSKSGKAVPCTSCARSRQVRGQTMYLNFFGLSEQPFGVTPDPRFLYLSEAHKEALASLYYGIEANRGFIGHRGSGCTRRL